MKFRDQKRLLSWILAADFALAAGLFSVGYSELLCGRKQKPGTAEIAEASALEEMPEPKVVSLTFDDGPNKEYTALLLDGLKERGVKASFFLLGKSLEGEEELVRRMASEGHLIGVHGMDHKDLTKMDATEALKEVETARELIFEITGKMPQYMRPPYGKWSGELSEGVSMEPVFWDVDSIDWKLQNISRIVSKVLKDTEDGDIILMHDEFSTSVEAAFEIIDNLQARGYTFVTVDELSID